MPTVGLPSEKSRKVEVVMNVLCTTFASQMTSRTAISSRCVLPLIWSKSGGGVNWTSKVSKEGRVRGPCQNRRLIKSQGVLRQWRASLTILGKCWQWLGPVVVLVPNMWEIGLIPQSPRCTEITLLSSRRTVCVFSFCRGSPVGACKKQRWNVVLIFSTISKYKMRRSL